MSDLKRNPNYLVSPSIVDAIAGFLRDRQFKAIHYLGYADDELCKSLIREGRYTLSLMDYFDRHHREGISFCMEEGYDHSDLVVPDWLDGIPTYIEGAPPHEVLLQDIPWLGGQLDRIAPETPPPSNQRILSMALGSKANTLAVRRVDRSPKCIILFGEGDRDALHPAYAWREIDSLRIGLKVDTSWQPNSPGSELIG